MTKQTSQGFQGLAQLLPEEKRLKVEEVKTENPELEREANGLRSSLAISRKNNNKHLEAVNLNKLGVLYRQHGEYQQAINYFHQVLAIDKYSVHAFNGLGMTYFEIADYDQAIEWFSKQLNPVSALTCLSRCYRKKGDYNMAINYVQQVLDKEPDNEIAIQELGVNYRALEQYDEAISWFNKGLKSNSHNKQFLDGIAITYRKKGDFVEAINWYQKLLTIDRKNKQAMDGLGITYREQGNYAEAINWYQKRLVIDPKNKQAMDGLGITYREQRDFAESINWYQKLLIIDPENKQAMDGLGITYREQGDFSEAIVWYKKLLEIDSKNKQAMDGLGITYREQGDYAKAIEWAEKLLDIQSNNSYARNNLRLTYQQMPADDNSVILLKSRLHHELNDHAAKKRLQEISEVYESENKLESAKNIAEFLRSLEKPSVQNTNSEKPKQNITKETTEQRVQRLEQEIIKQKSQIVRSQQLAASGSLSSGLAHEMMQPLQVILMTAQNCQHDIKQGRMNNIAEDLDDIVQTVKRIDQIITHLHLLFSDRKEKIESVAINDVINNSLELFNKQLQTRGIEIKTELAPDLALIKADKIQLEQVMINLINNSRDALVVADCEHKQIIIRTHMTGNKVEIEVEDNGIGIDENQQAEIFQAFTTHKEKGVGLGLYLSKNIIDAYNGEIHLNSKVGQGTCFLLSFPSNGIEA